MTAGSELSLWWRGHRGDRPRAGRWMEVDEDSFQEDERRITGLHRLPGPVPDWAEDLFRVARAAFIADKYTRRSGARDRWTRSVRLSVPVTEYGRWQSAGAGIELTGLLQVLTADLWDVEFRPLTGHGVHEAMPYSGNRHASEVAVFSGGLDSLSWAATRARASDARPLLLVMFSETKLLGLQRRVLQSVERLPGARPVLLLQMGQTPKGDGSGLRLESSSRTRGLLYAAGAIRAAAAHQVAVVHIPENGQLALNPPLTPARSAACSTRSVHPWTLTRLNALIDAVAGAHGTVHVVNPWATMTKGEVCKAGSDSKPHPDGSGIHPQLRQATHPTTRWASHRQLRCVFSVSGAPLRTTPRTWHRWNRVRGEPLDDRSLRGPRDGLARVAPVAAGSVHPHRCAHRHPTADGH